MKHRNRCSRSALPHCTKNSKILEKIKSKESILTTLHRSENVDREERLSSIIKTLIESKMQILFPLHPSTKKRLKEIGIFEKLLQQRIYKSFHLSLPRFLSFDEKFKIHNNRFRSAEEATAPNISKNILIFRNSTERPEAIRCGATRLVYLFTRSVKEIRTEINNDTIRHYTCPFGDGYAAKKIVNIVKGINQIN